MGLESVVFYISFKLRRICVYLVYKRVVIELSQMTLKKGLKKQLVVDDEDDCMGTAFDIT